VNWPFGALLSEFGVHGLSGYDLGLHSAIENHGATESSNQCVTSLPGVATVGLATGSVGSVSVHVESFPDPGLWERNVRSGSSCPM
jgi:hypothetical protein